MSPGPGADLGPEQFPRVAIVHERFTEVGGSERVVEQFHRIWPDATVHVGIADPRAVPAGLADAEVRPSRLQKLYKGGRGYAHLLALLPWAMAQIDVGDVDLVVTSHHAFANRVRVPAGARFISYTHTPARWMWDRRFRSMEGGPLSRAALAGMAIAMRRGDRSAARRPDLILVNSAHVGRRVREWWDRNAEVLHPPVDTERFAPDPSVRREEFFLLAGRLVPYKRPQVAVAAASRVGVRLVVVGEGRLRRESERLAGPRVEFLGEVDDETLVDLFRRCTAVLMPGEEDFGLVPVEAQACGAPVLALASGGACESVLDGITGTLYPAAGNEVEALAATITAFDPTSFDPAAIRRHAETFSTSAFRARMDAAASRLLSDG